MRFFFSMCAEQTQSMPCSCLTVDWLPVKWVPPRKQYSEQKLLLGTQAPSGEQNFLMVAQARLPIDMGLYGSVSAVADGDEEHIEREGGYRITSEGVEVKQRIIHKGDVFRARHMPQTPTVVATLAGLENDKAGVYVFDLQRHPNTPDESAGFVAELQLFGGLDMEGYGLAWNEVNEGVLAACGNDGRVAVWDTAAATGPRSTIQQPLHLAEHGHSEAAEDVRFHPYRSDILATAGDDGCWKLWDLRDGLSSAKCSVNGAHGGREVNTVTFSPVWEYCLATGGSDGKILVWDLRSLSRPMISIENSHSRVMQLEWSHQFGHILASAGQDENVVKIWDLSLATPMKNPDIIPASDSSSSSASIRAAPPPELLFEHRGHKAAITDFAWNACDPWTVASIADDFLLEVWQPTESVHTPLVSSS